MKRINLRAYAIIQYKDSVLLSDEFRIGKLMTKFPGGGHEWGEGLVETVKRECIEELNQEPISVEHFYTTDFFVASAFRGDDQLISIYYNIQLPQPEAIQVAERPFAFEEEIDGAQVFRWVKRSELSPDMFTYPIDQHVALLLQQ